MANLQFDWIWTVFVSIQLGFNFLLQCTRFTCRSGYLSSPATYLVLSSTKPITTCGHLSVHVYSRIKKILLHLLKNQKPHCYQVTGQSIMNILRPCNLCNLQQSGHLFILTLTQRDDHLLNPTLIKSIREYLDDVKSKATKGSVLITAGEGESFCQGFDYRYVCKRTISKEKITKRKWKHINSPNNYLFSWKY